jgi:hypothetical protein
MRKLQGFGIGMLMFALILATGCTNPPGNATKGSEKSTTKSGKEEDHDHDHGPGPHGGTIIEFGKWHGEFCVDHGKKQVTVYILGGDAKKAAPIKTEKLLLSITQPAFQVELKPTPQAGDPAGTASCFVAVHDNFGKEQEFAGTLSGVVNGTPYAGDFKEEPAKDHKHDKK